MPPMRIASRDLQVVSVGLVSAVLLAGCSGNSSKPTVLPALTTSAAAPAAATAPAPAPTTTPAPATSAVTASARTDHSSCHTTASPTVSASATLPPRVRSGGIGFRQEVLHKLRHQPSMTRAHWLDGNNSPWDAAYATEDYHNVSSALAAGDRYKGAEYRLVSQKVIDRKSAGAVVRIAYYVTAGKAYNSAGKVIASIQQTKTYHATCSPNTHPGNGTCWRFRGRA